MARSERYGEKADRALDAWVKLVRAFSTLTHHMDDHIRTTGLTTPQFGVLECLGHKGPMCPGELSKKQLVSCGNMTVVVDNLEKEGLVVRKRSKEDRRKISIELTKKGQAKFDAIFPDHARFVGERMSVLDSEEQEQLGRLLKKLGTALREDGQSIQTYPSPERKHR
jgi:MarR family 2-MHQ and catechol resistance regulon transcriptional repressor